MSISSSVLSSSSLMVTSMLKHFLPPRRGVDVFVLLHSSLMHASGTSTWGSVAVVELVPLTV